MSCVRQPKTKESAAVTAFDALRKEVEMFWRKGALAATIMLALLSPLKAQADELTALPSTLIEAITSRAADRAHGLANRQDLKEVASSPLGPGRGPYVKLSEHDGRLVLADADAVCEVTGKGDVILTYGSVLVSSKSPTRVRTILGDVFVGDKAAVLVEADCDHLRVVNLFDYQNGSVSVVACKRLLRPRPGIQVLVTRGVPSVKLVFGHKGVGHRSLHSHELENSNWITTSELKLAEMMLRGPFVKQIHNSKAGKAEKKLVDEAIKTAAAVHFAVRRSERFHHLPESVIHAKAGGKVLASQKDKKTTSIN